MAIEPVIYGGSNRPPRGDYSRGGQVQADYTCPQNYAAYTEADHNTYRLLHARQSKLLPGLACDEFIAALPSLGDATHIPRFDDVNERLVKATGWQLVAVPGLIPEVPFFTLLANRQFPVTDWIRKPEELDYIVEPDVFHDLFGHVPLLFNPVFADKLRSIAQPMRQSLTYDQGSEMARHKELAANLNIAVYFCDPHSPWQKGSVENTNGLVRQYLPKGTDLSGYTQEQLDAIADEINNRPRKTLNAYSPLEVYREMLLKYHEAPTTIQ